MRVLRLPCIARAYVNAVLGIMCSSAAFLSASNFWSEADHDTRTRVDMHFDVCFELSRSWTVGIGDLDTVSAITRSFPGVYSAITF